jgi:NTE family protein
MGKLTYRRVLGVLCNALFIAFLIEPVFGQAIEEKTQTPLYRVPRRPKVGLVLSGGGARGVAHVGVLKVLEELRVPVDFVAGASMGSLIGGIYASGMSPGEMEKGIGAIDWDDIMNDQPKRQRIPWRQKRDDFRTLFGLEMGLRGGKILLPLGMTSGYKFEFVMTEFVGLEAGRAKRDFNSLPIPYRAVGTDLENGEMKVFGSGSLVKAMRASMSIPAAFAPVEIDKRLYVDGGIVRNLPVDVARQVGCDIIIAVNLGTPPLRLDQVASAPSVALQTVNLMTEQNVKASLGELTKKDILIEPKLGDFSSGDFDGAMKTIPIGIEAARAVEDRLRLLSVSDKEYEAWQASRAARKPVDVRIADIKVADTMKRVNPQVIEANIKRKRTAIETQLGGWRADRTELQTLHRNLATVYGSGDFERLDYSLGDGLAAKDLVVEGVEKSWGPNYVKFGLGYASDTRQEQRLNLSLMHRMTWLNRLGAEWRNDISVGYISEFHTEFYQPFIRRVGIFAAPWLDLRRAPIKFYYDNEWVGEYMVDTLRGGLDLGVQGELGELRLGFFQGTLDTDARFGVLTAATDLVPEYDVRQGGWVGRLVLDQLGNVNFPREGYLLRGALFVNGTDFGAEDDYRKVEANFLLPIGIKRHTLTPGFFYGESPDSRVPAFDLFKQGGFLHFSGYILDQLVGDSYYMGRLVYTYRLASLPSALGTGVYLGGSIEGGEVRGRFDPTIAEGALFCGSLFLGADTALGPFYVAYGRSWDGSGSVYVMLGVKP